MLHKKRKPSTFTPSSGFADCKRNATSNNNMLHSKSTYFYRWFPVSCSLALLLGLGIILNPATNISSIDKVYAETITANPTDYSSISLTISNNGAELSSGDTISTNVEPGLISYISNNLKIDTKKINRFYVSVQAAEDSSSELTGTNNHATIAPVGSNKIPTTTDENGFGDNTWGFALGEASVDNSSMSYNSLPAYGTSTTPQYSSASNLADGTYNLKLTFAAKINADKPSDHYTTKAMVSVAADAKSLLDSVSGLGGAKTMQTFTSAICKSLATPSVSTTNVPTGQLVDTRDNSIYWIAKLADGDCWMTQNMAYDGIDNTSGNFNNTKKSILLVPNNTNDPTSYEEQTIPTGYTLSDDPNMTAAYDDITKTYNGHYLIGNYYTMDNNQATNACAFTGSGWKLPTSPSMADATATHGSYSRLLGIYSVSFGDPDGSATLRKAPFHFLYTGFFNKSVSNVGKSGGYWSSTAGGVGYFRLALSSNGASPLDSYYSNYGFPVRCVVPGA